MTAANAGEIWDAESGGSSSDGWGPLVDQVLAMGPCVVLVPLWSLAAGKTGAVAVHTACTARLQANGLGDGGLLHLDMCAHNKSGIAYQDRN
jgi:hypothetical protein